VKSPNEAPVGTANRGFVVLGGEISANNAKQNEFDAAPGREARRGQRGASAEVFASDVVTAVRALESRLARGRRGFVPCCAGVYRAALAALTHKLAQWVEQRI
jgi:hypothetical protein